GQDLGPLGQVERGDDAVLFEPLVDAELLADVVAAEDDELLVELLLQLALPLEGEIGGADDEDAPGQPPELQLADEQAGHDGLASAGVVGEQEADPGQFEEVVVDGLQLVGQRIDPGDGQAEVGVELVSDAEGVRLETETKEAAVAVVAAGGVLGV